MNPGDLLVCIADHDGVLKGVGVYAVDIDDRRDDVISGVVFRVGKEFPAIYLDNHGNDYLFVFIGGGMFAVRDEHFTLKTQFNECV